jgi:hypothetical protein
MKYIKTYESIFGDIARFGLEGRLKMDRKAMKIFKEMKEDFEKYNDFRKVMLYDGGLHYVFGEYHKINNSPMTGNKRVGNIDVSVKYYKMKYGLMDIERVLENPKHEPNLRLDYHSYMNPTEEEREKLRMYNLEEEELKITYDIAKKIIKYFNKLYVQKYPQLKNAEYKNLWSIDVIEKGEKPSLGSVDTFDKNLKEIIYPYYDIKEKEPTKRWIENTVCIEDKSIEGYPVTYGLGENEDEEIMKSWMRKTSKREIEERNAENIKKYTKEYETDPEVKGLKK